MSLIRSRDDLASPFAYSGNGRPITVVYVATDSTKWEEFTVLIDRARLTSVNTSIGSQAIDALRVRTRYEYHRLWRSKVYGCLDLFLSGVVEVSAIFRDLSYSDALSNIYREVGLAIHPAFGMQLKWNAQSTFYYHMSVPVLSWMSRNPYSARWTKNFQLVSLNRFFSLDHRLTWVHKLSVRWGIRLSYWGHFYRHTEPRTVQLGVDQLSAVAFWEL